MAPPFPNLRIPEEEDCLLCSSHLWSSSSASRSRSPPSSPHLLASMELSVRVEVEVAAVITSSVVAVVVVSSAPIATSSIAQSHFLTACRYFSTHHASTRGRCERTGEEEEYADLHVERGEHVRCTSTYQSCWTCYSSSAAPISHLRDVISSLC
jgi:hypothetical protein